MPGEDIQSWSVTAANNSNSDTSINWAEGQPRASVNNSARSMMAAHAKDRNLHNGSITTGGSANAQTFFSGLNYTAPIPTGLRVLLKIGPSLTNTTAATLEMDGLGAIAVKNNIGLDVSPGALFAGAYAEFVYNGTNWVAMAAAAGTLENIRVFTVTGTYPTTASQCKVLVYLKGGGGGGGGGPYPVIFGGGGGEAEEAWLFTTAAALSGLAMTVGAGGAQALDGLPGGTSSAGALCTAVGGNGGYRAEIGGPGGIGGYGGVGGSYRMPGACGHTGATLAGSAAVGMYAAGGGKGAGYSAQAGRANSGGGGGGGKGDMAPGNGGSGIIVCYEYGVI